MTYGDIDIAVRYEKHPLFTKAQNALTQAYAGLLFKDDIKSLFVDSDACDSLKSDAPAILVRIVLEKLILPTAIPSDGAIILPLLNLCPMKIAAKPTLPGNRLSTTTIKHAMDTNRATDNGNTIELSISVIPLHFPTHCNYLDWSVFN